MSDAKLDAKLLANTVAGLKRIGDKWCNTSSVEAALEESWGNHPAPHSAPRQVWEALVGAIVSLDVAAIGSDLRRLAALRCQSPLEEVLLGSLVLAAKSRGCTPRVPVMLGEKSPCCTEPRDDAPWRVLICPQHLIGNLHVDFLVKWWELRPGPEREDGTLSSVWVSEEVLVELDGHDFHDRTKEQASRDRKRDRDLQKVGFRVLRYTGSDVWKDPLACAEEVMDILNDALRGR